ncbi:exosortase-associated protein EpsI, B-type [Massilia sp. GCM10023247]|uniref:exosortase-associated protein EpsI, B-type n=1 Tax=Massilia sp. GCM10023247 TaxID=3252643 RepID=UPI0036209632
MKRGLGASLVLGIAMAGASALTVALTPAPAANAVQAGFRLEAMIPSRFGSWKVDPTIVPLTPSPEQQGALARIYDQTLSRTYVDPAGRRVMLSIAYGGEQSRALQLHLPEVCYVAQGFQVAGEGSGELATRFGTLPVQRLVATQGERNEPITYWITIGDRATRSGIEQKLRRLAYGLSGQIPDGMLVRISSITTDEPGAWRLHDRFAADLLDSLDAAWRKRLIGAAPAGPGAASPKPASTGSATPGPARAAALGPAPAPPAAAGDAGSAGSAAPAAQP